MKKLLILGSLVGLGALALQGVSMGHGGTYRGPGDTVPPNPGGNPGGGGPPTSTPGPGVPQPPGPPKPVTPGNGTGIPGQPGRNPGRPVTPVGASAGVDLTVWDFWWAFNKEPYLNLKAAIHSGGTETGDEGWFLGRGQFQQGKSIHRPSAATVRDVVVPALKRVLEEETSNDILTGAMIALAKIGDVVDTNGESEFVQILEGFLGDGNQEVAETAAVALGILGDPSSEGILTQLLLNDPAARRLIGKAEVPYRTRAFAAYGLGLVAYRSNDNELRQRITGTLVGVLDSPLVSTKDVKVACMTALGLCPVDCDPERAAEALAAGESLSAWETREGQLAYLLDYFDPRQARANSASRHYFTRAHAPTAMARLMASGGELDPSVRRDVAEMLIESIDIHSKAEREVQWGAATALGQIGTAEDAGQSGIDNKIRTSLVKFIKNGDPQGRRFAMISLAQVGGQPGEGEGALAGVDEVNGQLQKQLARGKTGLRPWAGLALGVFNRELMDNELAVQEDGLKALTKEAADCARPHEIGAYLIGLGIAKYVDAKDVALDRMRHFKGDYTARGYCAVSLGLMGERDVIPEITEIVRGSKYKPELLKQAAIALGLLGDKDLVNELVEMLENSKGLATQAALSSALGTIGDSRSVDPLVELLEKDQQTGLARGFAAVALGIVCDKEPLPWNAKISTGINYRASTVTLTGEGGTGILDIL